MSESDKVDFLRFLDDYVNDAREGFQSANTALLALEKDFSKTELLDEIFRVFHTLKSSSIMLEFAGIAELAHLTEDLLDLIRKNEVRVSQKGIDVLFEIADTLGIMIKDRGENKGKQVADWTSKISNFRSRIEELRGMAATSGMLPQNEGIRENERKGIVKIIAPAIEKIKTVKVHVDLLDSLFNIVGEIIILRNRLDTIATAMQHKELETTLSEMNRLVIETQDNVSVARMVPVAEIFDKFPMMVRDLAKERHKEIDFILEGSEIELDKAIIDAIGEPALHLLRNAIDHGIELPDERQRLGKNIQGKVRLAAKRTENHILIEVEDDGCGIDTSHIKRVAVKKGFIKQEEADLISDKNVTNLLFQPSFSTDGEVTGISGRGVGLYVVRMATKELGGNGRDDNANREGNVFHIKASIINCHHADAYGGYRQPGLWHTFRHCH